MSVAEVSMDSYHIAYGTSPPSLVSPPNEEEVSTIFVIGFPEDFTEREFQNMFTFAIGYECAMLKRQDRKQLIGFAKFETRQQAEDARDHLIGRRVDTEVGSVLKAEIAKKNLHTKKPPVALQQQLQQLMQTQMISISPPPGPPALQSPTSMVQTSFGSTLHTQPMQSQQQQRRGRPGDRGMAPGAGRHSDWPSFDTGMSSNSNYADELLAGISNLAMMNQTDRFRAFDLSPDDFHDPFHAAPMSSHRYGYDSLGGSSSLGGNGGAPDHYQSGLSSNGGSNSGSSSNLFMSSGSQQQGYDNKWQANIPPSSNSTGATSPFSSTSPTSPLSSGNVPYGGMGPPNAENPPCNTLYVGNLPPNTPAEELRALFSNCPGYRRLSFQNKANGAMCFVEFEDISYATHAMHRLHGLPLSTSTRGGIRLSYAKNSLGMRQPNSGPSPTSSYTPPPTYAGDQSAFGKHRVMAM